METNAQKNEYKSSETLNARKAFYGHAVDNESWDEIVRQAVDGFDGMRVLDLGCGDGKLLRHLCESYESASGVGVDASEGMIDAAKNASTDSDRFTFLAGDGATMQLSEQFDRVLILHVLHLVQDPEAFLKNALAHLKPGGRLVVSLHSKEDMPRLRDWQKWFAETTNSVYTAGRDHFTIESSTDLFDVLPGTLDRQWIHHTIRLTDAEPFVNYINTTRGRWNPAPSDTDWNRLTERMRKEIMQDIRTHGHFDETSVTALLTLDT